MKDERIKFGASLIAVKVVQEYVKFLEAGMAVEIEDLTKYYVEKLSRTQTEICHKKVMEHVGKLLRIRSVRNKHSK